MGGSRLLHNSRFYIVSAAIILSAGVFAWLRLQTTSNQLLVIQAEQCYGFISIGFLYLTLIISPIRTIAGESRLKRLLYARRGFGLSAFYYALLHATITLWGQLDGPGNLHFLPSIFKWSLLGGVTALAILAIMALTPSDQLIPHIPYHWWKRIHRLVYVAGALIILHVWTIGTHLMSPVVQIISFTALMVLFGLESFRFTHFLSRKYSYFGKAEALILSIILWAIIGIFLLMLPTIIGNYHSAHMEHMA